MSARAALVRVADLLEPSLVVSRWRFRAIGSPRLCIVAVYRVANAPRVRRLVDRHPRARVALWGLDGEAPELQRETGGFTEFVGLPFVHMAAPIYLKRGARRGPTWRETVLVHAVARIAYADDIEHVQASWVKLGRVGAQQLLAAGVDDLGGTLMDENISRAAGASHGQELDEAEFRSIVEPIGRTLAQRTTLYGRTQTIGRRLRPVEEHAPSPQPIELTSGAKS